MSGARIVRGMAEPKTCCPQCEEQFHPRKSRQRFCSSICARRSAIVMIPCLQCGAVFHRKKRATNFCSIRCAKLHHYATKTPDPRDILLARHLVDPKTGCWNWTGDLGGADSHSCRYGRVHYRGQSWQAHRLSFETFKELIPPGMMVCHRCDNPICINPEHLFLGTSRDNIDDMVSKRRQNFGARHPNAKLTESQVAEIRRLREGGLILADIASRFGIDLSQVGNIVNGKQWRLS